MTEREKRIEDDRRTEIHYLRVLVRRYPDKALEELQQMQRRARTYSPQPPVVTRTVQTERQAVVHIVCGEQILD